jgi:RNA polymerase sigma-70 factor (ECF subfamily)
MGLGMSAAPLLSIFAGGTPPLRRNALDLKDACHREFFPQRRPYAARQVSGPETRGEHQLDPGSLGDHIDRLYRAAWALCGSREEAEDLVQETFAKVLRKPRLVRNDDDLGYLLRVLRNTFISSRRAQSRRPREAPLPDDLDLLADPSAPDPVATIETNALYAAIAELPDDFRDALVAVDLVGLSYREAARALRVREATLTTRLHRARQRVAAGLTPAAE